MSWIKIHRQIKDNWIWDNPLYVKAWLTILMTVNYEPKKVLIQGELIDCNRGQALLSLQNWTFLFGRNWTIKKTRVFFDLLKRDSMIVTEGLRKTTRLTVCKYDDYQDQGQAEGKEKATKRQAEGNERATTKEDKEDQEGKKKEEENIISGIYKLYPSTCPINNRSMGKSKKDRDKIRTILKTMPSNELISIINNYVKECKESKTFMKNFSTFLNNLPEYESNISTPISKQTNRMVHYKMFGQKHTHAEKAYIENMQSYGEANIQLLNYVE